MYRTVELFSGIGSQMKAMRNIDMDIEKYWTCEWDIHAIIAYEAIHGTIDIPFNIFRMKKDELLEKLSGWSLSTEGKKEANSSVIDKLPPAVLRRLYSAILNTDNFVNVNLLQGDDLPGDIDIMTYSFPCQDVSNVGAFHGYNKGIEKNSGSRSSLLWEVGRILDEMRYLGRKLPRFLVMENVPALLSPRHSDHFHEWIHELEQFGYVSRYYQLNALDTGLPQNRPRLLMLSVLVDGNSALKKEVEEWFSVKDEAAILHDYTVSPYYRKKSISDLLRTDYSVPEYFAEACECTPNDTVSRQKIWDENPQLVLEGNIINPNYGHVRTITTKQDRNPNSGNLWFDSGKPGRAHFRYLTPRECMLFMGFTDEDYELLQRRNPETKAGSKLFSRDVIIRMAGNSIPVTLLEAVMLQIKMMDKEICS